MNNSYIIILAVVCFLIGIVVAFLVQSLREEKKTAAQESLLDLDKEPEIDMQPAPPSDMLEVARLWKDKSSQRLIVEIDGNLFRSEKDLQPAQLEELNAATSELCDWLKRPTPTQAQSTEVPAFLTSEPVPPTTVVKPPRRGPLDILKNSLEADVRSTMRNIPKSLAAQVDEILQEKLVDSHLADRGIRIMDTPSADLVVMVGLNKYDGIEAVPDLEIQAIIREAVAEWGRRTSLDSNSNA